MLFFFVVFYVFFFFIFLFFYFFIFFFFSNLNIVTELKFITEIVWHQEVSSIILVDMFDDHYVLLLPTGVYCKWKVLKKLETHMQKQNKRTCVYRFKW